MNGLISGKTAPLRNNAVIVFEDIFLVQHPNSSYHLNISKKQKSNKTKRLVY